MALVSRRRLVYYTILLTSFFWVFGTVSFFLIQSLEVNIEVKPRHSADSLPLQTAPKSNLRVRNAMPVADFKPPAKDNSPQRLIHSKPPSTPAKEFPRKPEVFVTANYENLPGGASKSGPGARGEGVTVDAARKDEEDEGFEQHAFNLVASDMMSLHRTLKDYRMAG